MATTPAPHSARGVGVLSVRRAVLFMRCGSNIDDIH